MKWSRLILAPIACALIAGAGCGGPGEEIPLAKVPPPPPGFGQPGKADPGARKGASPSDVTERNK